MDILRTQKWYVPGYEDDDGNPRDGAPYLVYRKADGGTQIAFRKKRREILEEHGLAEADRDTLIDAAGVTEQMLPEDTDFEDLSRDWLEASAFLRLEEGYDLCLEVALEHTEGCAHFMAGDEPIRWSDLPDDELGIDRADVLSRLGKGWLAVSALHTYVAHIISGLDASQKKG